MASGSDMSPPQSIPESSQVQALPTTGSVTESLSPVSSGFPPTAGSLPVPPISPSSKVLANVAKLYDEAMAHYQVMIAESEQLQAIFPLDLVCDGELAVEVKFHHRPMP